MRTIVSHLALLLEDEEQEIIDIRANGSLSHFLSYFSVMELSSPFFENLPVFLTLKEGSTSHQASLPSGTRGCNRPTVLNFLPLRLSCKESSTSNQAFLLRRKDVTALRCSEPLRSKVGGASKPSPCCAGWDCLGKLYFLQC